MIVALSGSHGAGKTTALTTFREQRTSSSCVVGDFYRDICGGLNYERPRSIVQELPGAEDLSITALTAAALGSALSTLAIHSSEAEILFDQSPIGYLAYYDYWMERISKETDSSPRNSKFLHRLCAHITERIDLHIHFPVDLVPLITDGLRPAELEFQHNIDRRITALYATFNVIGPKLVIVKATSIEERNRELTELLHITKR